MVYTIEAHPAGDHNPYSIREVLSKYSVDAGGLPIYQPSSYTERLELAKKTIMEEGRKLPTVIDEVDNPVWATYGPAPNIAYLIDKDGTVLLRQPWYDPVKMERAINQLL